MLPMFYFIIFATLAICIASSSAAEPDGWKNADRFVGFRYQLNPHSNSTAVVAIRDKADEKFCFGWIQNATLFNNNNQEETETLVGEMRCRKSAGHEMKSFLTSLSAGEVSFREYEDTLIRLHFSHFKIVSPGRTTCFRNEPHKCLANILPSPKLAHLAYYDELNCLPRFTH